MVRIRLGEAAFGWLLIQGSVLLTVPPRPGPLLDFFLPSWDHFPDSPEPSPPDYLVWLW